MVVLEQKCLPPVVRGSDGTIDVLQLFKFVDESLCYCYRIPRGVFQELLVKFTRDVCLAIDKDWKCDRLEDSIAKAQIRHKQTC
jgi:hypothetical protein